MKKLMRIGGVLLVAYLTVVLLLMFFEESLVFLPSKYPRGDWNPTAYGVEDVEFNAADGTRLHGWFAEHPQPRAVVLFTHGNAGNLTDRADMIAPLRDRLKTSVFLFDYRGYGRSEGKPTEAGVLQDARAARSWLAQRTGVGESDIVLIGRSLGGALAVDLAAADGARGLVLHSSFTSLPDAAAVHYPWAPVQWMMRTRLDSLSKIDRYEGPLLMCHGDQDEVVPYRLGRKLYDAAVNAEKQWLEFPDGTHNDPLGESFYQAIDQFIDSLPTAAALPKGE